MFDEMPEDHFDDTNKNGPLHDNAMDWDDEDQRLKISLGEVLNKLY